MCEYMYMDLSEWDGKISLEDAPDDVLGFEVINFLTTTSGRKVLGTGLSCKNEGIYVEDVSMVLHGQYTIIASGRQSYRKAHYSMTSC